MMGKLINRFLTILAAFVLALGILPQSMLAARAEDSFVTRIVFRSNGVELQPNAEGVYVVEKGKQYEVELTFAEKEGHQFDHEQMVFDLPGGIEPLQTSTGYFPLEFTVIDAHGNTTKEILYDNWYEINENGRITVRWNKDGGSAYDTFKDIGNVSFTLNFSGSFDGSQSQLTFSDTVQTNVEVKDTAGVTITKVGTFDPATNRISYTVKVKGSGTINSTNVVVTDELTGTALTLDTSSMNITHTSGAKEPVQNSLSEDGFQYTIATVRPGDEYTFTYTASVDVKGITGTGTVEQTENKASVTSDQDPDGDTVTTNLKDQIHYTNLDKSGTLVTNPDGSLSIQWTVTFGVDRYTASLAGFTLTDVLQNKLLVYDLAHHPDGITVQMNNGPAQTVSWASVGVNSTDDRKWNYTIPDDAPGNTKYTFTYYTLITEKDLVTAQWMGNTISDDHGHSRGTTIMVGQSKIQISKRVSDFQTAPDGSQYVVWTITLTVPAEGLTQASVRDYYPAREINGVVYRDKLRGDPVVSGLLEGETYSISENSDSAFTIDFHSDSSTGYALKPASASRQIIVTVATTVDPEWIKAGENSDDIKDQTHTNYARFRGNNQDVTSQDSYYLLSKDIDKTVGNNGQPAGYFTANGVQSAALADSDLPYWKFTLAVTGASGDINVTDSFDADLFEVVTDTGGSALADNLTVLGNGSAGFNKDTEGHIAKVTVTPTSEGATFFISGDHLPKYQNNPALFYGKYVITYYLRVKSVDALQKLRQICAEKGEDLTVTLTNNVVFDTADDSVPFYYTYSGVRKQILEESAVDPDTGFTYATFRIVFNPTAADLDEDSDTLTADDTWSANLAVVPDSFTFQDQSGNDISSRVSYDISGNTASFTIPDATAVWVTYRARILGTGSIDYSNTATMNGYVAGKSATAQVASSGGGAGDVFAIYLLKYHAGNLNQPLAGVTFSLYKQSDSGAKVPVKDLHGSIVKVTTDADGRARLSGSQVTDGWTFFEDTQYYLHEEQAPAGYRQPSEDYAFQVSSSRRDPDHHLYINGDTISLPNEPSSPITISGTKTWDDQDDKDGLRPASITVTLTGGGIERTLEVRPDADGSWHYEFTDLPEYQNGRKVEYRISEQPVPGYTAEYHGYDITNHHHPDVPETGDRAGESLARYAAAAAAAALAAMVLAGKRRKEH